MNEEKSIEILKEFKKTGFHTLMIKYNEDRIHTNKIIEQAIETILTHYEKQNSIIKNAIDYIQHNNKELKNYSEQEMLDWLYGLDKCCEIKEDK